MKNSRAKTGTREGGGIRREGQARDRQLGAEEVTSCGAEVTSFGAEEVTSFPT